MSTPTPSTEEHVCCMCGARGRGAAMLPTESVRPQVAEHIARRHADRWAVAGHICRPCLNRERLDYVTERLTQEKGALTTVEEEVAKKAGLHLTIARNIDQQFQQGITLGQRAADAVARVGGSWAFVISFLVFLMIWMATNTFVLRQTSFDPYPYILLNLVLSCLAALQAPIIQWERMVELQEMQIDLLTEIAGRPRRR